MPIVDLPDEATFFYCEAYKYKMVLITNRKTESCISANAAKFSAKLV